jgi:hypothetical protein
MSSVSNTSVESPAESQLAKCKMKPGTVLGGQLSGIYPMLSGSHSVISVRCIVQAADGPISPHVSE